MGSLERTLLRCPQNPLADVETPVPQEASDLETKNGERAPFQSR